MSRAKHAPNEIELQDQRPSNVIPFPRRLDFDEAVANRIRILMARRGAEVMLDEIREMSARARSLREMKALGVVWFHAVRIAAGPNAVWREDSADDGDPSESAPERPNRYPHHEATEIYPPMGEERRKEVAADIKKKGLSKKIVLCKNRDGVLAVLDGRARYDICLELGVKPETIEYDGDDPEGFLVSVNLMRRDLTDLQRCLIAARTVTAKVGGDRLSGYEQTVSISATCADGGKPKEERTIEEAAAIYRLNPAGVRRARTILNLGVPQFIDRIDSDHPFKLSTKKAIDIVTLTTTEKLDDLTSEEKQRQWLKDNNLFKRAKKPPLGPLESFRRKWGYLSPEDRRKFAANDALPWLIEQARLDGVTEIAIGDAKIIIDP